MKIYLVRHGNTDWNVEMRIQGQTDVLLNSKGIAEAEHCADYFKDIEFDKVYTSYLSRAIKTAEIITKNQYPLIKVPDLNERHFGIWQTQLWGDIHRQIPNLKKIWKHDDGTFRPEGGESLEEMIVRVQNKFKEILNSNKKGSQILIVAHGGPLKAMIGYVLEANYNEIPNIVKQNNCCINIINYHDTLEMDLINYVHQKWKSKTY